MIVSESEPCCCLSSRLVKFISLFYNFLYKWGQFLNLCTTIWVWDLQNALHNTRISKLWQYLNRTHTNYSKLSVCLLLCTSFLLHIFIAPYWLAFSYNCLHFQTSLMHGDWFSVVTHWLAVNYPCPLKTSKISLDTTPSPYPPVSQRHGYLHIWIEITIGASFSFGNSLLATTLLHAGSLLLPCSQAALPPVAPVALTCNIQLIYPLIVRRPSGARVSIGSIWEQCREVIYNNHFQWLIIPRPNNSKTQFPTALFIKVTYGPNLEKLWHNGWPV